MTSFVQGEIKNCCCNSATEEASSFGEMERQAKDTKSKQLPLCVVTKFMLTSSVKNERRHIVMSPNSTKLL